MSRRLFVVVAILLGVGCGGRIRPPQPFPTVSAPPSSVPNDTSYTEPAAASPPGPLSAANFAVSPIVATALGLRGTPYRNGGSDGTGLDCSGLVQFVFSRHGHQVPREVIELFRVGLAVPTSEIHPGDLLFFTTVAAGPSHVAIAIGDGAFVHAPSTGGVVRVEYLASSYWADRFLGARRLAD